MAQKCSICEHPDLIEINKCVVKGFNLTRLAKKYDLVYSALYNHSKHHLSRQLQTAYSEIQKKESLDVFQELETMIHDIKNIVTSAKDKQRDGMFLNASRELRNTLELVSRIQFALRAEQAKQSDNEAPGTTYNEAAIEQAIEYLDPTEKEVYFQILMKMFHGGGDQIPGITYQTEDITASNLDDNTYTQDADKTPYSPSFKRTRKPAVTKDSEDIPMRVRPVEGTPIPYTKHPRRGIDY